MKLPNTSIIEKKKQMPHREHRANKKKKDASRTCELGAGGEEGGREGVHDVAGDMAVGGAAIEKTAVVLP